MTAIKLISPVDGSVYAERTPLSPDAARSMAARAKVAQKGWAARPLSERIALVRQGVANLNAMKDRVVEELAWQMGRPTRFGGEFGGVNARTDYMAEIAEQTLAPVIIEDSDFRRIRKLPAMFANGRESGPGRIRCNAGAWRHHGHCDC